jgi:chromosome segregation protein
VLDELPETETDNAVVPKEMSKLLYFVADFGAIESDAENAVSENGAFIRRKGLRRIGTQMRGAISFAQEIEKLGANIDDLEKQLADAEKARKDIFLRRDESNGAFSNMKERENEIRKALSETENEIRELEYRYKSKVSDKADIEKRIENSSARKGEIETELSKLEAGRKSVADRVAELEAEIAKQSEQEIKAEEELRIWTKDATDAQMKFIQAKGELEGLQRELERLRLQYRTAETTIETAERRIRELKDEGERLATEKEKLSEEVQSLVVEKDKKEKEFQTVSENAREANDKLRQLDVELRDITSRASELEKVVHEKRMEKHEQELQAGFIAENLRSDYGIELDSVDIEEKLNSEDERKAQTKLERLKEKITDFGGINPDAEREYEEQKERLDFLTAQREDLVEAKNDLQKTIKKLNNTARRQFLETFEETRRHFKNIFAELFEGGEADLTLQEGEDVLETDIEISARPPGKRFLMINQLSQGEKALCAVSLLFGLYKVKPSPFCMLDEVDAPLDEANVGRFLRMLRRFSDETQFILITHNKRSMEATDYLYGITMQEDGVSKAISLKISDLVLDLEDK